MRGKTTKESRIVTSIVTLPQDANIAGNVHGGVIMKHVDPLTLSSFLISLF